MSESLKPEWRVLTTEDGHVIYHNDKTGEETKESPYLAQLNKYKNCDLTIWQGRRDECVSFAQVHPRPRINLDINFGERIGGRITVELFADVAPLAAYNFYCLCQGDLPDIDGQPLKLKGSLFHHCIPGMGLSGGDITNGDGTGGMSIYGAPFEDENLSIPLDRAGLLVMLSEGPNLNLSRFLITSNSTPSLFGSSCLFGRVVRGLAVVRTAMNLATDPTGTTKEPVILANTTIIEDGPIPENFSFPEKPSLRPNPMVPPACSSLLATKTVAGLAHSYTKQAGKAQDLVDDTPQTPQPVQTMQTMQTMQPGYYQEEEPEAAPGEDPSMTTETPAETPYDYMNYGDVVYGTNMVEDIDDKAAEDLKRHYRVQERNEMENKAQEEAYASIISTAMDDYRRGSMPHDTDGRALAHYLDLSTLDNHKAKKKVSKIPKGFKTWKEYGKFKKDEKRMRQVKSILEDKYPVEYLERRMGKKSK